MTTDTDLSINTDGEVEVIDRDILVLRDVISWHQDLICVAEELNTWECSVENVAHDKVEETEKRTSKQISIVGRDEPRLKPYEDAVFNAVGHAAKSYFEHNNFCIVNEDEGYGLLRYHPGSFYKLHSDFSGMYPRTRILSVLLYLNDDFEGGELVFPRQGVTLKPEPGTVVVFPSCGAYPHEAKAVTKGNKYVVVTWMK